MTTETTTTGAACPGDPAHFHGWVYESGRWRQACGCKPYLPPGPPGECPGPRRFLCVCQYGHCRSVALARALHGLGHTAVAAGYGTAGDALHLLGDWADVIFLLTPEALARLPEDQRGKVVLMDVGPDRWVNPYHPELAAILGRRLGRYFEGEVNP